MVEATVSQMRTVSRQTSKNQNQAPEDLTRQARATVDKATDPIVGRRNRHCATTGRGEQGNVEADSKEKGGRTTVSRAAERGHTAVVELLLSREDVAVNSRDVGCKTPLLWACKSHSGTKWRTG